MRLTTPSLIALWDMLPAASCISPNLSISNVQHVEVSAANAWDMHLSCM
uniref:Uncharacterized protein n=1 Tax=Arundo donax TaxID=35708 RepID=A0A0A9A3Z0_ARUDO